MKTDVSPTGATLPMLVKAPLLSLVVVFAIWLIAPSEQERAAHAAKPSTRIFSGELVTF